MYLVTAAEMQRLDREAIGEFGLPGLVLMENAGLRVVEAACGLLDGLVAKKKILILAGKGNNGGDGLVAARHLANAGAEVKVFLLGRLEEVKGDAATNLAIWRKMGGRVLAVQEARDLARLEIALLSAHLVIDAIYGTGFRDSPREPAASVMELINRSRRPVLAVDLPSGLDADSGNVAQMAVKAQVTVTMGLPKLGLYLHPGATYAGRVVLGDISFPASLVEKQGLKRRLLTSSWCSAQLPARPAAAHKGDFGHVLVVGGSPGLSGAVVLAARAALRGGAGLVTAAVPRSLHAILEEKTTAVMTHALPETPRGTLGPEALEPLLALAQGKNVVALGPGLSRDPASRQLVQELLPALNLPLVLDADGLNALEGNVEGLVLRPQATILTPHPGEMARLLGCSSAEVQSDRLGRAEGAARRWRVVLVLKGAGTLVAGPEGDTFLNPTGCPGMATGGSGDVLTGVVASVLSQGLSPLNAAALAVYVHGRAGELAACRGSLTGLIAGDVVAALPEAWGELESERGRYLCDLPGLK